MSKLSDVFTSWINKIDNCKSIFKEEYYVANLAETIKESCVTSDNCTKNNNYDCAYSKEHELSFNNIICDKSYTLKPKDYLEKHMGGTDIVVDYKDQIKDEAAEKMAARFGIEFKPFYSTRFQEDECKNKDFHFMNAPFFNSGKFSKQKNMPPTSKGAFIQNGQMTICKEGQLLSDIARAIKVLPKIDLNTFLVSGVIIYPYQNRQTIIKKNIEKILHFFLSRIDKDKTSLKTVRNGIFEPYICIEEDEKNILEYFINNTEQTLWVGNEKRVDGKYIDYSFENMLFLYPFYMKITKN